MAALVEFLLLKGFATTAFFLLVLWTVILDMLRIAWRAYRGEPLALAAEAPYQRTQYAGAASA